MAQKKVILASAAAVVVSLTGYALAKNKDDIEQMGEATMKMAKYKIDDANYTVGESFESANDQGEKSKETMKDNIEDGMKKVGDFFKPSEQVLKDDNDQKTNRVDSDLNGTKEKVENDLKAEGDDSNTACGKGNDDANLSIYSFLFL